MTAVDVRLTDTTLRDGSHAVQHTFTEQQVRDTVAGLDAAGVPVIELSHGDGLGGSSFNYGFSRTNELELIAAAREEATRARIASLLVPGVGRVSDLRAAAEAGIDIVRVATHCTEADVAIQHFAAARELGLETVGFLMLSHMVTPRELAAQARVMVDAGCQCAYVVDSAGALVLEEVRDRVRALVDELGDDAQVGFHAHNNLGLSVANSVIGYEAGARQIDGSTRGLGAGAGNAPTELLATVFDRLGIATGVDAVAAMAVAEDVVAAFIPWTPIPDRDSIVLGYAGAYSSFLLHAHRAAERYGVPAHEILLEVGRRGYVGGQEDMLIDVALSLAGSRGQEAA
jgi:4-hydroxy 2-oxovalerate aldolase